jgi:hypothetical protein
VPSYVISKICHASLADSQFEILANSEGESAWHRAWRAAEMFGRMQVGTEASRYSVGSRGKRYVVRTDDDGLSGVRSG